MATLNINDFDNNVSRLYKGYFQIYDSSNTYKYMQLTDLVEKIDANVVKHYGTTGIKKLVSIGYDAEYTITIKNTADLYDTDATPTDAKSISYFIDKIMDNEIPEIEFEGVEVTNAATNKYIRDRFKGGITGTELVRDSGTGVYLRKLTIEITDKVKVQRTAT